MKRILAALLLVASSVHGATVADVVSEVTATAPFDRAIWFILIQEEDGTVVHARNASTLAIPASVRKLFSAATIAECLGLDGQIATELWLEGQDVILRGGGDPSLGTERYGYIPEPVALQPFVQALKERGVRRVGDVVVDVALFDRVTLPYQWKMGNLLSSFAAPVDAIAWSENVTDAAVASAGHLAGLTFRDSLVRGGIEVLGTVRVETEPRSWRERVAVIPSPPMYQLLATVLKPSHNLFAEMLFKRSAAQVEPGTYDRARELEQLFAREAGIDDGSFRFVDGSGLAPDDLVTPEAVVRMLRWMNHPARRGVWWNLLAAPGEAEGTLRSRLPGLAERLRAKTGSVAGVNTLAGIIAGRSGGARYFVVMVNHHTGSSAVANRLIDRIVEAAADF